MLKTAPAKDTQEENQRSSEMHLTGLQLNCRYSVLISLHRQTLIPLGKLCTLIPKLEQSGQCYC